MGVIVQRVGAWVSILLLSFSSWTGLVAATQSIEITEKIGREHNRELVAVQIDPVDSNIDQLRLLNDDREVPFQITDLKVDPHGQVQSGKLWFVLDEIKPFSQVRFELTDTSPSKTASTSLSVAESSSEIHLSTGAVQIWLPQNGRQSCPPPVLGVQFGEGPRSPASEWIRLDRVKYWETKVLAKGPVFAQVRVRYQLLDDSYISLTATAIAGNNAIRFQLATNAREPASSVIFFLPANPDARTIILRKGYGQWSRKDQTMPANSLANRPVNLGPNTSIMGIFRENPSHLTWDSHGGLQIQSHNPGGWVPAAETQTYYGGTKWDLSLPGTMWNGWKSRVMPIRLEESGFISLKAKLVPSNREWTVAAGDPIIGQEFLEANQLVLDWDENSKHPLLFVDAKTIAARNQYEDEFKRYFALDRDLFNLLGPTPSNPTRKQTNQRTRLEAKLVEQLEKDLGKLGNFDVMRKAIAVAGLYDALIDSPLISPDQRERMRAQMAYLGYVLADPMCWSSERGYGTGNPNMHVSYIMSLGVVACVLRDHPMADKWANYAADWLDAWLDRELSRNGNWLPEGSHYGIVSLESMLSFAIAAERAGYRDFTNDERLKSLVAYFANMLTPPDPRFEGHRATGAYGRGTTGEGLAVAGMAAQMTADKDPEFSARMQWAWKESGFNPWTGDTRLGGFAAFYLDRNLPSSDPKSVTSFYPNLGVLFRSAFNTDSENYLNFLCAVQSDRNLDIWTPSVTDIVQWFGRGQPISTNFTFMVGTQERHTLTSEGVQLARNFKPGNSGQPFGYYSDTSFEAFSTFPGADYARTERTNNRADRRNWLPKDLPQYPNLKAAKGSDLTITRQLLFIKDHDPNGPSYVVLRDTTRGGEPTAWQFWTLSNQLYPSNQSVAPKSKLDQSITPARQLPHSDRYTAEGQFDVFLEYYVAAPQDTPRHTLRYGGIYQKKPEFQDLFHLQLPDDGAYFLAMYPRLPNEPQPTFETNRKQTIIHAKHLLGSDYAFLSNEEEKSDLDDASFRGTAACIKLRKQSTEIVLLAPGEAEWQKQRVKADAPISATWQGNQLMIQPSPDHAVKATIRAQGKWTLQTGPGDAPETFRDTVKLLLPQSSEPLIYSR
ncbi:MAG: hypothetical protein AAFX93_07590 [Verrucomicrobiota bacterium]